MWSLPRGRIPSCSGGRQSWSYESLQLMGWGPSTLWKAVCFTQSLLISVLLSLKKNLTQISTIIFGQICRHCGPANWIHKINNHSNFYDMILKKTSIFFFSLSLLAWRLAWYWTFINNIMEDVITPGMSKQKKRRHLGRRYQLGTLDMKERNSVL